MVFAPAPTPSPVPVRVNLYSDTQTKPSQAMREAMADAEVGDEQEREDPTVLELERRGAELLGQEEAVYLPTATMGNQIALAILGERGSELVVEERAHIMVSELGGAAMHSGLQTRGLPGYRGRLTPEQLRAARASVQEVRASDDVLGYVVDLVRGTRTAPSVQLGVSPRGATALLAAMEAEAV